MVSKLLFCCTSGPMKEKELTPGTVYPVLGKLLFFLPERYKEKLCCVTPLGYKVSSYLSLYPSSHFVLCHLTFESLSTSPKTSTRSLIRWLKKTAMERLTAKTTRRRRTKRATEQERKITLKLRWCCLQLTQFRRQLCDFVSHVLKAHTCWLSCPGATRIVKVLEFTPTQSVVLNGL